jgi:ATP-dependent Zn protease
MSSINQTITNETFSAYHEAGHAVSAVIFGYPVSGVDIEPRGIPGLGMTLGFTDVSLPAPRTFLGKGIDQIRPLLIILLAGTYSERIVNPNAELDMRHDQSDGSRALFYITGAICPARTKNGTLTTESEDITINSRQINDSFANALNETEVFINECTQSIENVAKELLKAKVVSPERLYQLVELDIK